MWIVDIITLVLGNKTSTGAVIGGEGEEERLGRGLTGFRVMLPVEELAGIGCKGRVHGRRQNDDNRADSTIQGRVTAVRISESSRLQYFSFNPARPSMESSRRQRV
jgi:hypothetical protein